MKPTLLHRPASVLALFSAYTYPCALIEEAAEQARERGVPLEAVAIVSPVDTCLVTVGIGMAPVPFVSVAAQEDAIVRDVTRLIATVPQDVSVCWRLFHGRRRQAIRELLGQAPGFGRGGLRPLSPRAQES